MDAVYGPDGELSLLPRMRINKPVPRILHPKDVYIRSWETNTQEAEKVGFRYYINEWEIESRINKGEWDKDVGQELLKQLTGNTDEKKLSREKKIKQGYFTESAGWDWQSGAAG